MRTIKFRGKQLDGEWVCGFYQPHANGKVVFIGDYSGLTDIPKLHKVIPESVGQWTGLVDKNGVEIYEGDVMVCRQYIGGNFIDYCIERGFVEMLHGAFGLHRKQGYYRPFKDWLEAYEYEIIGNIYENPELLK